MSSGKTAVTRHPIHPLLAERWSPRAFAERSVAPEAIGSLLEAARWAPSSNNEQPWRFVVARREDAALFQKILGCLVPFNQAWAQNAPVLLLALAQTRSARDGRPNRLALYDVGQAVAHLTFQASALGLAVHQMAGIDLDKIRADFALPEDLEPAAAAAIGYAGDPATLPDRFRQREALPRERKGLEEIVLAKPSGEA